MSQHGFSSLAAAARDGGDLTAVLEAIQSGHIGTTRPSYAEKGMLWAKDIPGSNLVEIYLCYTDTQDTLIGTVDTVTGAFSAAGATPSGVTVLSTTVISTAVASVDLTGFVPADYTSYEIELINVVPATDSVSLYLRTSSDSGSTWDSGGSDYGYAYQGNRTNNTTFGGGAEVSAAVITEAIGSATSEDGVSGVIRINGPHLAKRTMATFQVMYDNPDAFNRQDYVTGGFIRKSSADVDGVQVYFSSGNIESGTIVFRGIK